MSLNRMDEKLIEYFMKYYDWDTLQVTKNRKNINSTATALKLQSNLKNHKTEYFNKNFIFIYFILFFAKKVYK